MMISRWSPIRRVVQSTRIRTFSPSDEPTGFSRWLFSPPDKVSPRALQGMIDEFVTRDGTDYGERETGLAEKVAQVRAQLQSGQAGIVFFPLEESFQILRREEFPEGMAQV